MNRLAISCVAIVAGGIALAACSSNKGRPGTVVGDVLRNSTVVTIDGLAFNVGVSADRRFAIVGAVRGKPQVRPRTLERAAERKSSCKGKFALGVLAFYKGGDVRDFKFKLNSPLRVDLTC